MKVLRFVPVLMLALSGVLVATTSAAGAAPAASWHRHGHTYNCTGGTVAPGHYNSMIITGVCYMPAGTISIRRDLIVAPGALLDATTPGDPTATPLLPATVLVGGNVFVGDGAVLFLGCSPNISCSEAVTYDRIGGNLTAIGALGVVVHSTTIDGNFSLLGGGDRLTGAAACTTIPALWGSDPSLANGEGPGVPVPVYSDAEDNFIGGNLTVIGLESCWLGSLRDQVGRSATFIANTMGDPDAMEIDNNLIGRNMTCFDNLPAVQYGDGGAAPNMVGGFGRGECGFKVLDPNPAPAGTLEHIAVSTWSLGKYYGTHVQTSNVETITFGTTKSNDTLVGALNNDTLNGTGLTGSITVVPKTPVGSTGEAVLATVHPNGSESFLAFDTCTCSFDGQSGTVTIRAYGTTSANGFTRGTFLITSGTGGLATLAGWGKFSSYGQPANTLGLVEHLRIT